MIALARPRLTGVLARRHELDLIVLEAPGGSGRSVLLDQALARPVAGATDVRVDVTRADAAPGALARRVLAALGGDGPPAEPGDPDAALVAIAEAARARAPVALVLDGVERAGEAGAALVTALAGALPADCGLVVSGRWLPSLGRATRVAAGTAAVLGPAELALRSDEVRTLAERGGAATGDRELMAWPALAQLVATGHADLVPRLLHEVLTSTVDPVLAGAVLAVAVTGGGEPEVVDTIVAAVAPGAGGRVPTLTRLPLIRVGPEGIWPHPIWAGVADRHLAPEHRHAALEVAVRARIDQGALVEAGRLALRAGAGPLLATTVRAALSSLPARAPDAELERWLRSELLADDGIEARWLRAALAPGAPGAATDLEAVRTELAEAGDHDTELAVLLHLGQRAFRADDAATLAGYVARGHELAGLGVEAALPLAALGRAVVLQLGGRYREAVAVLDELPTRSVRGDVGAQVLMVRGTNLLLADDRDGAMAAFTAAGVLGSTAATAVAHHLRGLTRWMGGDAAGAIDEARRAVDLAAAAGMPGRAATARGALACYLALAELPPDPDRARHRPGLGDPDLDTVADVVDALGHDLDAARRLLGRFGAAAARPTPTTVWRAALETAVLEDRGSRWEDMGPAHPSIARAVAAGRAGAAHLAGGPPAAARHRPFLPARWCEAGPPRIELDLLGPGRLRVDGRPTDDPRWRRPRVRELALHLAVHPHAAPRQVAAALWPDVDDDGAARNLQVALTRLLDLLDPDRPRGERSLLLVDQPTVLGLAEPPNLVIDVRVLRAACSRVVAAAAVGDVPTALGAARVVLDHAGPLLEGRLGEWAGGVQRDLDAAVVQAVGTSGPLALDAGRPEMAEALGRRGVLLDRGAEAAHRLVVAARLGRGDLAGARRAAIRALVALDEAGAVPNAETLALVLRSGLRPPWTWSGAPGSARPGPADPPPGPRSATIAARDEARALIE